MPRVFFFFNVPYLLPNSSVPVEYDKGKTLTKDKSHSSQTPFTYVTYQQCKYNNIILVQEFNSVKRVQEITSKI